MLASLSSADNLSIAETAVLVSEMKRGKKGGRGRRGGFDDSFGESGGDGGFVYLLNPIRDGIERLSRVTIKTSSKRKEVGEVEVVEDTAVHVVNIVKLIARMATEAVGEKFAMEANKVDKNESAATEEWRSSMKHSFVRVSEEEKDDSGGGEEVQIRSIHNDGHFNHHRLSKLSIHTNNDEFFYVGGHPPSEGRTSLRSRGTISRQSMLRSSEFLSGTQDDELAPEAFGATVSPQVVKWILSAIKPAANFYFKSMKSNLGDGGDPDPAYNEIFEDAFKV
ncbi:hypothetical protein TELCIR_04838 [Teladorsagia circumcincta]|uniref:Uncharacterized protein n=1 Tax=Teladorsagia circumcincta TaxID=45464 RepID=A0A2G9UUL0_TELCI|nr:hypothetical protein TELCIR_04838 [Teladorsagia circumcincta]